MLFIIYDEVIIDIFVNSKLSCNMLF